MGGEAGTYKGLRTRQAPTWPRPRLGAGTALPQRGEASSDSSPLALPLRGLFREGCAGDSSPEHHNPFPICMYIPKLCLTGSAQAVSGQCQTVPPRRRRLLRQNRHSCDQVRAGALSVQRHNIHAGTHLHCLRQPRCCRRCAVRVCLDVCLGLGDLWCTTNPTPSQRFLAGAHDSSPPFHAGWGGDDSSPGPTIPRQPFNGGGKATGRGDGGRARSQVRGQPTIPRQRHPDRAPRPRPTPLKHRQRGGS